MLNPDTLAQPATKIPEGLVPYRRTPEMTEDTIPAGLRKAHSTKEGTWGLIRVIHGELVYRVVDKRRQERETILSPEETGVVEPGILHEVQPNGPVRFFVEFYRSS